LPNTTDHPAAAALAESVAPEPKAERRSEARYPTHDPAELELLPQPGGTIYGIVLDVSRSGMRVCLPVRVDRGAQVKVKLHGNVIFGEVRYCRAVSGAFHAGLRIQDVVHPPGYLHRHIADDPLSLYTVGRGLSVTEVIEIREHLGRCETCRGRLAAKEALLNPARKARPYLPQRAWD
jgi:hypothetical protein